VLRLRECAEKINITGGVRVDEPLAEYTTFRVGGPADLLARPHSASDLAKLLQFAEEQKIPWFVLGGGSNVLVSDRGIRGLVIETGALVGQAIDGLDLTVGSGVPMSDASAYAADHELAGLDFIYAMPGSVGGAVWMNARCYDGEISDVLASVDFVGPDGSLGTYVPRAEDFDYKRSPFMDRASIMTSVTFHLKSGDRESLWTKMRDHESDRTAKGHFAAPCAGSVFKNNRAFGAPSGALIDRLGLRGFQIGGARVSDQHANIVVNTGDATAADIRAVIEHVRHRVAAELGLALEREVLYVGDWRTDEHE